MVNGDYCILKKVDSDSYELHITCVYCSVKQPILKVTMLDWGRYTTGRYLIQEVFPEMSVDERELIMTGTCTPCWDQIMGDDDK